MVQIAYRIFDVKDGKIKSLFHATRGSRTLPTNCWIQADKKMVKDGSGSREYLSGFHVFADKDVAENFFNKKFRIKDGRKILPCYVKAFERKKSDNVYLVSEIYIPATE